MPDHGKDEYWKNRTGMSLQPTKDKICKICLGDFTPWSTTQRVCSPTCAIEWNRQKDIRKQKKKDVAHRKAFYEKDLQWQHKRTQPVFNKLRRLQEFKWFADRGLEPECISCGKKNMDWCCGHLKTVASQGSLRYSPINTQLQCNRYCNENLSGNINGNKKTRGYLKGLVVKFGENRAKVIIDYCSVDRVRIWTCEELIEMRKNFSREIRILERLTSG